MADAAQSPADADTQAALRLQLKKLLQEDPDLLAEATRLLADTQTGVTASGGRSGRLVGT